MKDRTDNSNLECTNQIEVEVRLDAITVRNDFKITLDPTTHTEDNHIMDKTIEVGQELTLITEVAMGIIQEVAKGMGGMIITLIEGEVAEVKIMIGIGVGNMKDRVEIEGMVEALAQQ